jgi:hypothetical protein
MDTDDAPFLVAAVRAEHADWARRMAKEMALKHRKADVHPQFYLVWDPEVLPKEDYARLVVALGGLVRKAGGVGVMRLSQNSYGIER